MDLERAIRWVVPVACLAGMSCTDDDDGNDGNDDTSAVGTFEGLHDGVAVGFNFPFDIGLVPDDPKTKDDDEGGDIFVANYGTSEVMRVPDPAGESGVPAQSIFDGTSEGLMGATAISIPHPDVVWASFEQGGAGGNGGIVILEPNGKVIDVLDADDMDGAFARPGGLCYGGRAGDDGPYRFFFTNMDDGTVWRIFVGDLEGTDPVFERVGEGLATGNAGRPGSPGNGLTSSSDLPEGGVRGCAYHAGRVYVADAQNARIVRFEDADKGIDITGDALEDTPGDLVTYPTDVAVNEDGYLLVISYDNAHAFVSLELPGGGFFDDGLQELNVNSGNYGMALGLDTIWFTRANNKNGTLRAVTPEQDQLPSTEGPYFPQ